MLLCCVGLPGIWSNLLLAGASAAAAAACVLGGSHATTYCQDSSSRPAQRGNQPWLAVSSCSSWVAAGSVVGGRLQGALWLLACCCRLPARQHGNPNLQYDNRPACCGQAKTWSVACARSTRGSGPPNRRVVTVRSLSPVPPVSPPILGWPHWLLILMYETREVRVCADTRTQLSWVGVKVCALSSPFLPGLVCKLCAFRAATLCPSVLSSSRTCRVCCGCACMHVASLPLRQDCLLCCCGEQPESAAARRSHCWHIACVCVSCLDGPPRLSIAPRD